MRILPVTVSKAVYTGKSVKPVVKIVETEGDNTYTHWLKEKISPTR